MKWILCLALTVAVVSGKSSQRQQQQQHDQQQQHGKDVSDYQAEILKLYQNIGAEDTHDFVRKEFPFADTKYFTEPRVVDKFMMAFKDGFLDKEGYFNLYSYKNRHDTYRLFDLFYYAKDFETFMKVAKWAKFELNPIQFVYAFTSAIYHRKDTQGVIPPPFYEVLPHYFTPSYAMHGAYKAMIQDVKYRKFDVNGTGYEYSWYHDHGYDKYSYGPKYGEYDVETRLSYFREDVGVNDWYSKFFLQMAPWLSDEKYPNIQFERRGEYMYTVMKWLLTRYNLERFANGLPPVEPLYFKKPIKTGYNSELFNIQGRPFFTRPDGLVPYYTNPMGVEYLENMYHRYMGQVDSYTMYNPLNTSYFPIEDVEGFDYFTQVFYGISHPDVRKYYQPLYYQALETLESSIKSSNDVGYTGTTIGNFMTEMRDPAFYRVLAYLDKIFFAYNAKKTPYTKKDIHFPGVKISSFDFPKVETFFERYEYDISNGVPYKGDSGKYKYLVSKWRLNYKPFSYKINIQSDKQVDATVKVFFAPKYDSNYRQYGFTGFEKHAMGFETFHVTLKSGSNTLERKFPTDFVQYKETPRLKHIVEHLQRSKQSKSPLHYPAEYLSGFPSNMGLPRGSKEGTEFQVVAFVYPKGSESGNHYNNYQLIQEYDDSKFLLYPFDRPASEYVFQTPNVYFTDFSIYDVTKY